MFIINHKNIFIGIGLAITAVSLATVLLLGLRLGIDFTGGSLMEASYVVPVDKVMVESSLNELDLGGYSLRETEQGDGRAGYVLRTRDLTEAERQAVEGILLAPPVQTVEDPRIERFTSIGPVIGQELRDKAGWAIGGVILVIILYVAFAFAGVRKPVGSLVYGGITILVLIHDVIVPAAVMALMGYFIGTEVDVLFVMAILAVLGYSVNDTIVVFDRVRENLIKYRVEHKVQEKDELGMPKEKIEYTFNKPFGEVVAESVSQTIVRSVNTSLTTLLALLALYFLGGVTTQTFALILIIGVLAGTYSSIFLASPLLVWYAERLEKKVTSSNQDLPNSKTNSDTSSA